jgi:hypothetical protein
MSPRTVIVFAAFVLVLCAAVAGAADVEGKIQSVDATERTLVLENGLKVWLPDGMGPDAVKEGAEVRVSYEERDGRNVATSVELK